MRSTLLLGIVAAVGMQAATISFTCLTDNGNGCAGMVGQLSAEVTDPGSDQVLFTFINAGPTLSTIAEIYWDDDDSLLDSIDTITNSAGVDFGTPANPADLPSGANAVPAFSADFSVGATPPPATNGVDPGENLPVLFDLSSGSTFDDILAALESGSLRLGMHVISIGTVAGSDAVISEPYLPGQVDPIPEPSTYMLMGAGLLALGALKNRTRK